MALYIAWLVVRAVTGLLANRYACLRQQIHPAQRSAAADSTTDVKGVSLWGSLILLMSAGVVCVSVCVNT